MTSVGGCGTTGVEALLELMPDPTLYRREDLEVPNMHK